MKLFVPILSVCFLGLNACGNKNDASEKNFHQALVQHHQKHPEVCINTNKEWPLEVGEMSYTLLKESPKSVVAQMDALASVGLVKVESIEEDAFDQKGKPLSVKNKFKRYTLTQASEPSQKIIEVPSGSDAGNKSKNRIKLCWGTLEVGKVVKWEGPIKLGDYQEVRVRYTYKINNIQDWAKSPSIHASFPYLKGFIEGNGNNEMYDVLKLTSQGWEFKPGKVMVGQNL